MPKPNDTFGSQDDASPANPNHRTDSAPSETAPTNAGSTRPAPTDGRKRSDVKAAIGAIAGAALAAVISAVLFGLIRRFDTFWSDVTIAAVVGAVIGSIFASQPIPAEKLAGFSWLGVAFGFVPGLLMGMRLLGGGGAGVYGLVAVVFIPVAIGFITGAFFDRAFDEYRSGTLKSLITAITIALLVSGGLLYMLEMVTYGPGAREIAFALRSGIYDQLNGHGKSTAWKVLDVQVHQTGRRTYEGTAKVKGLDGEGVAQIFDIKDTSDALEWSLGEIINNADRPAVDSN